MEQEQEQHRVKLTANNLVNDYCNRAKKKVKNLKHEDYLQIIGHAAAVGMYTGLKMAKDSLQTIKMKDDSSAPETVEGTTAQ